MIASHLSFPEIRKHAAGLAVLPVGSLEQHGLYLPLGTDSIVAEKSSKALEKRLHKQVVLFPTLYYGCSKEHHAFPGTVYLEFSTYLSLLKEVFTSIFRSGFTKLLIVGGHGGNNHILQVAQVDWNYDHPNQKVHYIFAFTKNVQEKGKELFSSMESHAGSVETSLIYSLSPDYIKTRKKSITNKDFKAKSSASFSLHPTNEICKYGVVAKTPTLSINPELGKKIFEVMVNDLVEYAETILVKA